MKADWLNANVIFFIDDYLNFHLNISPTRTIRLLFEQSLPTIVRNLFVQSQCVISFIRDHSMLIGLVY